MNNHYSISMGCEYQPLLCPRTLTIVGYEALARFYRNDGETIAPNRVFDCLHQQPQSLAQLEFAAKWLQLTEAPANKALNINLDPHALTANCQKELLALLGQHPKLTVELIENSSIGDAKLSHQLLRLLKHQRCKVALDDIGDPNSMLSLQLLSEVDSLKFDIHWLQAPQNYSQRVLLKKLVEFANITGKSTVLEGVETKSQLAYARDLGIQQVQGFLFKQEFVQSRLRQPVLELFPQSEICQLAS